MFVKLFQIIYRLILNFQRLSYQNDTIRRIFRQITWSITKKRRLPLIKNIITPLAESILIPLRLSAAASAADAGIHKKILGSGNTTLIKSNKDMEDLIKIVKFLEDFGLLLKRVTESVQTEVKEQKGGFLSMLPGTLGASLLGNLLTGKGIHRAGEGIVRAGEGNNMDF